jgi:hypothetical protein
MRKLVLLTALYLFAAKSIAMQTSIEISGQVNLNPVSVSDALDLDGDSFSIKYLIDDLNDPVYRDFRSATFYDLRWSPSVVLVSFSDGLGKNIVNDYGASSEVIMIKNGPDSAQFQFHIFSPKSIRDLVPGPSTNDEFSLNFMGLLLGPTPPADIGGFFSPMFPDFSPLLPFTYVGIESFDTQSIYDFEVQSILTSSVPLPASFWFLISCLSMIRSTSCKKAFRAVKTYRSVSASCLQSKRLTSQYVLGESCHGTVGRLSI